MYRNCEICNERFYTRPCRIKKGSGRFCSRICFGKWWSKRTEHKCLVCKKIFSTPSSMIGKFCSRKCLNTFNAKNSAKIHIEKRLKRNCQLCKKEFSIKPSVIKRGNRGIFCSQKCQGIWTKKNMPNKETSIEKAIEVSLKKYDIPYIKQCLIGNITVADFLIPDKIVVQCDGDYWHSPKINKGKDAKQDTILNSEGYRIFRFSETEIKESPDKCILKIAKERTWLSI